MDHAECKRRIEAKIAQLKEERLTGKAIIEIDMNNGGFRNLSFYSSSDSPKIRGAMFIGRYGFTILDKHL
jgi:hypothetical protein